jgi:tetratricopeptide (TPR) repeat protein
MHRYGLREVEKLLALPRSTIRALIDAGFVTPVRGARNALLFSFQDLVVLRTAQALAAANVSRRRITKSLRELRHHLPESMPLSGLSICAVADRVVVKEAGSRWQAESGQYLLAFEGDPVNGSLSVIEKKDVAAFGDAETARKEVAAAADAEDWFERGVEAESEDPAAAMQAYERAIAADPAHLDARINLGWLLHQARRHARAERDYREALAACGDEPVLLYNLAVLLEDMGRGNDAVESYQAAIRRDPAFSDCHYNLALLFDSLGRSRDAIRHMAQYRRLVGGK